MSAFEPSGILIRLQELIHVSVKPQVLICCQQSTGDYFPTNCILF